MAKAAKASTKVKAATKRTAKKPTTVKRVSSSKNKHIVSERDFFEFRLTHESLYWIIFGAASIFFALWMFMLDARVRDLYDQIDAASRESVSSVYAPKTSTSAE